MKDDDARASFDALDAHLSRLCTMMENELSTHAGSVLVTMRQEDIRQTLSAVRMYRTHLRVARRAQENR